MSLSSVISISLCNTCCAKARANYGRLGETHFESMIYPTKHLGSSRSINALDMENVPVQQSTIRPPK